MNRKTKSLIVLIAIFLYLVTIAGGILVWSVQGKKLNLKEIELKN